MALSPARKKQLRRLGHALKPVIVVADKGLTASLVAEFERTLQHHELMKVSVRVPDRRTRDQLIESLCEGSGAELVQRIGHVALVYRRNPETAGNELAQKQGSTDTGPQ